MPKVYLNEKQKLNDRFYVWVVGQMKLKGISQTTIARELGMSQQMFSYRLNNKKLLATDLIGIVSFFQPDLDEIAHWMGVKGNGLLKG